MHLHTLHRLGHVFIMKSGALLGVLGAVPAFLLVGTGGVMYVPNWHCVEPNSVAVFLLQELLGASQGSCFCCCFDFAERPLSAS